MSVSVVYCSSLAGVDFTSRPSRRKPITVALGHLEHGAVQLEEEIGRAHV